MQILKKNRLTAFLLLIAINSLYSCREVPVPKPKGYFRIDLPPKNYIIFNKSFQSQNIPLRFEYPAYGIVTEKNDIVSEPGWFNIEFPHFSARIYLTYKKVKGDLASLIEQTYSMNVKNHIAKADAINEQVITDKENRIFGILYDLKGNTATSVQFYLTDSLNHYLRGSLYFNTEPNADSLAPLISFFREDIVHLIETLRWEK